MPETTLHPGNQPKAHTVVAEPTMTAYQALRHMNFFSNSDFILFSLVILTWTTLLFWKIFAQPTFQDVVFIALVSFTIVQIWLITLVYRCMHFVVLTQAYVNTLPQDAARIATAMLMTGSAPLK